MSKKPKDSTLNNRLERLTAMIVELKEDQCMEELRRMLDENIAPDDLLNCCMEGMRQIGIRFEKGVYFIAALIMAGEIMRSATEMLSPFLLQSQLAGRSNGTILMGTVQGDIHDLGKNLVALLLKCNGIDVVDLGVDVPAEVFVKNARSIEPDMIGISCVLTNNVDNLKSTVQLLRNTLDGGGPPIIVGGTCMDERMAAYIGSCIWARDAATGLHICRQILNGDGYAA
jgi:methanogenic corrinoid protein MtbC1